jgi:hypothetical protein
VVSVTIRKEETMPEPTNAPEPQDRDTDAEAKDKAEEIEVVAHSEDELPCGGNACGGFAAD